MLLMPRAVLYARVSTDLRDTCATFLLSHGQHPKLVQKLLHASLSMILNARSQVPPRPGDGLADRMDDTFG